MEARIMLRQMDATGEAHEAARGEVLILSNARVVTPRHVLHGSVVVENGRIVEIHEGPSRHADALDFAGDYLLPGLVDIHTDHFEKHLYPRAHVRWDFMRAALAHDAQIIGGGVTTVFDSLCVGATTDNPERAEILKPMIEALEQAQRVGMLRAEHLVHLRCELTDPVTPHLTSEHIGREIVRVISVMEHLPGIRQSRDVEAYVARACKSTGESPERVREKIKVLVAEKSHIAATTRPDIVALARARSMPLMSHDDTDIAHRNSPVRWRRRKLPGLRACRSSPVRRTSCAEALNPAISQCGTCWLQDWSTSSPRTMSRARCWTPPS
jgi:alpha-D-ribose 1-methylphosphonate 5-triphosphate diphosphatase